MCNNCGCSSTYTDKSFYGMTEDKKKKIYRCTEKCSKCHRKIREYWCQE